MKTEDFLKALLSKTLNIDDSKFAELVKIGKDGTVEKSSLDAILNMDKDRVTKLKEVDEDLLKDRFNNGYAKAKQEAFTGFEKELQEKFNVQSTKKGIDLVTEIISANTKSKGEEMTPEKIKISKVYLDMIDSKDNEKQTAIEDALKPFQEKISTFERQSTLNVVNKFANGIIDELNPRFSEDKVKASNQRNVILKALSNDNYKIDGERITLLNEKGEQLNDQHGNPVKFEDRVKGITVDLYDLSDTKKRKSGGSDEEEEDGGKKVFKWDGIAPKDQSEYQKLVSNAGSVEEKKAIMEAWHKVKYEE